MWVKLKTQLSRHAFRPSTQKESFGFFLRKELSQVMSPIVRLMKELLRSLKLLAKKFRSPLVNIPRACFKPHLGCKPCGVASFRVQNESDASTKRSAKEHNLNRKGFVSSLSSLAFRKQGHQTIVFEVSVYPRVWINRLINPRSSFEPVFL